MIRYILENEFQLIINCPDYHETKGFVENNNIFVKDKKFNLTFEEIVKEKLLFKEEGEFFHSYESKYSFNKDATLKLLKKISFEKSRLLLHEKLFFWFPDYLELSYKKFNIIMNENGVISIPTRYYIAIMVNLFIDNLGGVNYKK